MYNSTFKSHKWGLVSYGVIANILLMTPLLQADVARSPAENAQVALSQTGNTARKEIEKERKGAEKEAQESVVPEAAAVIELAQKALDTIGKNNRDEALRALEEAIGKTDILLARHPEEAMLPFDYLIDVVDTAPYDLEKVQEIAKRAEKTVKEKKYVEGRIFLDLLRSEINIRTFCLPLGVYPAALKEAAHLLERNNPQESRLVLLDILNTIVTIHRIVPIPLINAKVLFAHAEEHYSREKAITLELIDAARHELNRAKKLGYITEEEKFLLLNRSVEELIRHVKADKNVPSMFNNLREKMDHFMEHFLPINIHSHNHPNT